MSVDDRERIKRAFDAAARSTDECAKARALYFLRLWQQATDEADKDLRAAERELGLLLKK